MNHLEIKICKTDKPLGLAVVQGLWLMEVHKVFVIGKHLDGKWGSMEIVTPGFKGSDDSEQFSVIDVIVPLSWAKGLREVGAGMPITVGVSLEEDGAQDVF
jgi:hypothetical protein